MSIKLITG